MWLANILLTVSLVIIIAKPPNIVHSTPIGLAHAVAATFGLIPPDEQLYGDSSLQYVTSYITLLRAKLDLNGFHENSVANIGKCVFGDVKAMAVIFEKAIKSAESVIVNESRRVAELIDIKSPRDYHIRSMNRLRELISHFMSLNESSPLFSSELPQLASDMFSTTESGCDKVLSNLHRSASSADIFSLFAKRFAKSDRYQSDLWKAEAHGDIYMAKETLLHGIWHTAARCGWNGRQNVDNQTVRISTEFHTRFAEQMSKLQKLQSSCSSDYQIPTNSTIQVGRICFSTEFGICFDDNFNFLTRVVENLTKWGLFSRNCSSSFPQCIPQAKSFKFAKGMVAVTDPEKEAICGYQMEFESGFAQIVAKVCLKGLKKNNENWSTESDFIQSPDQRIDYITAPFHVVVSENPLWRGWITGVGFGKVDEHTIVVKLRTSYFPPFVPSPIRVENFKPKLNLTMAETNFEGLASMGIATLASRVLNLNEYGYVNSSLQQHVLRIESSVSNTEAVRTVQSVMSKLRLPLKRWFSSNEMSADMWRFLNAPEFPTTIRQYVLAQKRLDVLVESFESINVTSTKFDVDLQLWTRSMMNESVGAMPTLQKLHSLVAGTHIDNGEPLFSLFYHVAARDDEFQSRIWKTQAFADTFLNRQAILYGLQMVVLKTQGRQGLKYIFTDIRRLWNKRLQLHLDQLLSLPTGSLYETQNLKSIPSPLRICVTAYEPETEFLSSVPISFSLSTDNGTSNDECASVEQLSSIHFSEEILRVPNPKWQTICKISIAVEEVYGSATMRLKAEVCRKDFRQGASLDVLMALTSTTSGPSVDITAPFRVTPTRIPRLNGWVTAVGFKKINVDTITLQLSTDYYPARQLSVYFKRMSYA